MALMLALRRKLGPLLLIVCACIAVAQDHALAAAAARAFRGQSGAAVVVRVRDGQILAAYEPLVLTRRIATPGSSLKPFVLELLLANHLIRPDEPIMCRRTLTVAGKRLDCSHPPELVSFTAEDALAFSCNSYFVTAAARLRPGELERRLLELGFTQPSGLLPGEGAGRVIPARTLAERQLLAVGAAGIQITPLELAAAYRQLARIDPNTATPAQKTVLAGLHDSVDYGMAHNANAGQFEVAGKTGTASDPGSAVTHAWFAGFAPARHPEIVVVVFVERGRGSLEASTIAHQIFAAYAERRP